MRIQYDQIMGFLVISLFRQTFQWFYCFQVGAYTRLGDGELTKAKKVKTPAGNPGPPRIEATKISEDDGGKVVVKLQWSKPDETYGALKGYKVTYGKRGAPKEHMVVKEMLPSDGFISIEGLSKFENQLAQFTV